MRVIYNGIDLMVLETLAFDAEAVYDDTGTDYLFTRVSMTVRALVNGQATVVFGVNPTGPFMSYDFNGKLKLIDFVRATTGVGGARRAGPTTVPRDPNGIINPRGAGVDVGGLDSLMRGVIRSPNLPLLTHRTIRHRLETPRGKLFIFAGRGMESGTPPAGTNLPPNEDLTPAPVGGVTSAPTVICVASPEGDAKVDCKNGPLPRILSVENAMGDAETLVVVWSVETFMNEGPLNLITPISALLSNRFSQTHEVNEYGYTTVSTRGTAIFRTDRLYGQNGRIPTSPDRERPLFFMPIMPGFVRENIQVLGRADVTGVDYTYQDRQVVSNFVAGPFASAVKINVEHRQAVSSSPALLQGALALYERFTSLSANKKIANAKDPEVKPAATPGPSFFDKYRVP